MPRAISLGAQTVSAMMRIGKVKRRAERADVENCIVMIFVCLVAQEGD